MTTKKWADWTPEKNKQLFTNAGAPRVAELGAGLPATRPPAAARVVGSMNGFFYYVPVSFVAKDWNVSTRRIRALLAENRLQGVLHENGYWGVVWPYQITLGKRGPALKRPAKPERRKE